jgi:hypothetical protein
MQNLKIPNAQQAKSVHGYENIKTKILRGNAAIWFNKICKEKNLTPRYINIKIKSNNTQNRKTKHMATHYRINQELKFLYAKKQQLNRQLYKIHLECASRWDKLWDSIQQKINDKIHQKMKQHYDGLHQKLKGLTGRLQQQNPNKTEKRERELQEQKFHHRIENLSNIELTNEEVEVLELGPQHCFKKTLRTYLPTLAVETEIAIKTLDTKQQDAYRVLATKKLENIINKTKIQNTKQTRKVQVVKQIKKKLIDNGAMITQADKGKTMVIITQEDYAEKVLKFLTDNSFPVMNKDPTTTYHNRLHKILQDSDLIISKQKIKHLLQKTPTLPELKARIKLHKIDKPIRPVVNNINAPSYKIAKHLKNILTTTLDLQHTYNVVNSPTLASDLTQLKLQKNHVLVTYDIKDLYVNIPINEVVHIIKNSYRQDKPTATQIARLTKEILAQNYFSFQNKIYHTNKGVAMGSPISSIIAEIFLQHYENVHIKQILERGHIAYYTRYMDDILIIYDNNKITQDSITKELNKIHNDIKLNPTPETNGAINYLDLHITRHNEKLTIGIYRKPTSTDITIHNTSNHPTEHKHAAYRYYINRMNMLPITLKEKQKEWEIINTIANNNGYSKGQIHNIKQRMKQTKPTPQMEDKVKTRITFTYFSPHIRSITNLFKRANVQIVYKTTNSLQQLMQHKEQQQPQIDKYNKSGVYRLICNTCNLTYIGQTSRTLTQRYKDTPDI